MADDELNSSISSKRTSPHKESPLSVEQIDIGVEKYCV